MSFAPSAVLGDRIESSKYRRIPPVQFSRPPGAETKILFRRCFLCAAALSIIEIVGGQETLDAHQGQPANQTIAGGPPRNAEGQPASARSLGLDPVTGGGNAAHPPVPEYPRFKTLHLERQPDAERRPDPPRRSGTNESFRAFDRADGGSPAGPGVGIRHQPPYGSGWVV